MDTLMFEFKTDFSTSQLYHKYTHPEDGPAKQDILLYIFSWSMLDRQFHRGPAENAAKDLMVNLITQYATRGLDTTNEYPRCTAEIMVRDGLCPYLVFKNSRNDAKLTTSNAHDAEAMAILGSL